VWLRRDISTPINYWTYCKQYSRRSEFKRSKQNGGMGWAHPVGLWSIFQRLKSSDSSKNGHSRGVPPSLFSWPRTSWRLFGVHIPPWLHFRLSCTPLEICVMMGSSRSGGMKRIISSTAVADFCTISCRNQEEILSFNASYVLVSRTHVRAVNCNQTLRSVNSVAGIIAMTLLQTCPPSVASGIFDFQRLGKTPSITSSGD
jgi:hypothetical protein